MSDDVANLVGAGLPKGTGLRKATDKAKAVVFGDENKDNDRKRRNRRLSQSVITQDFAPTQLNQGF
jgi:hypothetical protein